MDAAVKTLFDVLKSGAFEISGSRCLFLNAVDHPEITDDFVLQQYFKPYVDVLTARGFSVEPEIPDEKGAFDVVCVLVPKNVVEARYLIARAMRLVRVGGRILCTAENKAGGKRLKKMMQDFGLGDVQDYTKHKARCVWAVVENADQGKIEAAMDEGAVQEILKGRYVSQPGVFGWHKIDKGSEILVDHLPEDLKGRGADFGCGYGYLAEQALDRCSKIKKITCLDADYRAVGLCEENLKRYDCEKEFVWTDLTTPQPALRNLDFIIMNPPFHDNKKTDYAVGQAFIDSARQSLRRGGALYMVANNHLPYEVHLNDLFEHVEKRYEGQGFKIYCAR